VRTDMLHGDVIAGMSAYDELDHEIVDVQQSAYRPVRGHVPAGEGDTGCAWSADVGEEFAGHHMQRLRDVGYRPDDDVRRDVLRLLLLDSLVPITVDAQVSDGVVTLTGTVGAECERQGAKYLAGLVPGAVGVIDELVSAGPSAFVS
jgi:osmotically-inducible protein OsmY